MMQLQDTDVLKDIPGYQAILRAVLKSQIQLLVEQLADATGEESIILTASVNDGTLCHLGSLSGKDFLEGREEIKTQFLRHCLKKRHKLQTPDEPEVTRPLKERRTAPQHTPQPVALSRAGHYRGPVQIIQAPSEQEFQSQSPFQGEIMQTGRSPRNLTPNRAPKGRMKTTPFVKSTPDNSGASATVTQTQAGEVNVKLEQNTGDMPGMATLCSLGESNTPQGDFNAGSTEQAPSQLQTDRNLTMQSDLEQNVDSNISSQSAGSNIADDSLAGAIVKQETSEDDLEITGIEPGMSTEANQMGYQGDWAPDMSYGPGSMGGDGQMGMEMLDAGNQSQAGYMAQTGKSETRSLEAESLPEYTYQPVEYHGEMIKREKKSETRSLETESLETESLEAESLPEYTYQPLEYQRNVHGEMIKREKKSETRTLQTESLETESLEAESLPECSYQPVEYQQNVHGEMIKREKKFQCSLCSKSFYYRSHLSRHTNTHTGVRFACSVCDKTFQHRDHRNVHELHVHKIIKKGREKK